MDVFIILAQSRVGAENLQQGLTAAQLPPGVVITPIGTTDRSENNAGESLPIEFESLVAKIEESVGESLRGHGRVIALADRIIPRQMNAGAETARWSHLIAMLVLTFPDVVWMFDTIGEVQDARIPVDFPLEAHAFRSFFPQVRRSPLLDPTGLRNWIKQVTNLRLASQGLRLPVRPCAAAAIEDEKSYAYFHAYVAYRFGFRADMVISWTLMETLFGPRRGSHDGHGYHLLLEDVSLKFPDKLEEIHLADFKMRAARCPQLGDDDSSKFRIIITTGQVEAQQLEEGASNNLPNKQNGSCLQVLKPAGGMFDLWRQAGLREELGEAGREGNAPGFDPLPEREEIPVGVGHGSPGRLMLIAEHLLRRSEKLRSTASTMEHFIAGATLANDALELLGGRIPTMSLAALALKHEYEVRAESTFIGVGFHLDVISRQKEIERDVGIITQWYDASMSQKARSDAIVVILNRLASVFRQASQFEEEQEVLAAVRREHRRLVMRRASYPGSWVVNLVLLYAEWLLASFGRLIATILGWNVIFASIWWVSGGKTLGVAVFRAFSGFFGGNAFEDRLKLFSCLVVITGVFHIGVFISYLYSIIFRRQ